MHLEVTERRDRYLQFELSDSNEAEANKLRTILLTKISAVSINKVVVYDNESLLKDEYIVERLGLSPVLADPEEHPELLTIDVEEMEALERRVTISPEVPAEGIKCFELNFTNDSEEVATITTGHLRWIGAPIIQPFSLVHDSVVLTRLPPHKRLHLECYCDIGIGERHIRYSSVSLAVEMHPRVTMISEVRGDNARELERICPTKVFSSVPSSGRPSSSRSPSGSPRDIEDIHTIVENERRCTHCLSCQYKYKSAVELGWKTDQFTFYLHLSGALSGDVIIERALKLLA